MRIRIILFTIMLFTAFVFLLVGCEQPEYYHPYGEGVDPDSVTTGSFVSRTTTTQTASSSQTTTTTTSAQHLVDVVVPEGYRLCPECDGIKIVCEVCEGTGEVKGDVIDPDVYVDYTKPCENCSLDDPGFYFCEVCRNELVIPE